MPDFIPSSQTEELTSSREEPDLKEKPSVDQLSVSGEAVLGSPIKDRAAIGQASISKDEAPNIERYLSNKSPPPSTVAPPANTLPPPLLSLLQTIQSTLLHSFPIAPPHTAQRLAELLLHPKKHYRTLPSYLRALDRIVSVASPASIFPLPDLTAEANLSGRMMNGTPSPDPDPASDRDFIGGAELTEIPWLRNTIGSPTTSSAAHNLGATSDLRTESKSLIDGPNGAGSVETVSVNVNGISSHTPREEGQHGITQGELLRQEQEAGVVPVPSPQSSNGRVTRGSAVSALSRTTEMRPEEGVPLEDEEPETVHARGPGVIGMEDMGPQAPGSGLAGGLDLEGALGRRGEGETVTGAAPIRPNETRGEEKTEDRDGDGDVVVADADGVVDGQGGIDQAGENRGVDAVDGTAL